MKRRDLLIGAVALVPGIAAGVPLMETGLPAAKAPARKLKIVVTGGHPGDPEAGCGGTIARYTAHGHEVTMLYLNRGEGYCGKNDPAKCGAVRTAEAEKACTSLKARAAFAGQIDARAIVDGEHYEEFNQLLMAEKADVVFTHWPIDSHRDHRAIASLTLDTWVKSGKGFTLYYYEVAEDTMMFDPAEYVDITAFEAQKKTACFAHASQSPEKWYPQQTEISRSRGRQHGCELAEAFAKQLPDEQSWLP
jgi:LmbE family N-acetylglucosaminyl deacetylase